VTETLRVTYPGTIPIRQPWVALSQAAFNQMNPEDLNPSTLYIVGATRIYQGPTNVFPPPFGGGLVNVTDALIASNNPVIPIPSVTVGNLVVIMGNLQSTLTTAISDSAGQVWQQIGSSVGTGNGSQISGAWYCEGSAAITDVRISAVSSLARAVRIMEFAGIAQTNALDVWDAIGTASGFTSFSATVTPNSHCVVVANLVRGQSMNIAVTANPDSPWVSLPENRQPPPPDAVTNATLTAYREATPGAPVTARWAFASTVAWHPYHIAAFRIADGA
jgi:hypothetical protein